MRIATVIEVTSPPKFNPKEGLWEIRVSYKDPENNHDTKTLFVKTEGDARAIRKGFTFPVKGVSER
ncbi:MULTISPECIES: hypothetical protein [Bacillus]|uniref:Uncharacterized protein n=1 Tax=Bacillus glycinifermentans TaxID=1664069 RepID=A0A0T6BIE0_9BACI|nr:MULTISPECIES: hypothetical protein [Bacillus]KRT87074.1 hypothetical protein AB447_208895 [Bacillus glycinifermentans]MEC0341873.1 hypothetical protein [Bacillus sonorensis]MEC0457441.1 hypothetical protein [Bacillus sonorensis]MEC0487124.1 hypothetical protein [Bacillus glycinifermentans]MEC0530764.1 hypothetical protein [Bacillus sonorensis]